MSKWWYGAIPIVAIACGLYYVSVKEAAPEMPSDGRSLNAEHTLPPAPPFIPLSLATPVRLPPQERSSKPNIVLIIVDTLRADCVGAYNDGLPPELTPNLDRFANNGTRFERVVAQSAWTRPSTASLLTAKYPRSVGVLAEGDKMPMSVVTIAEVLKEGGYRTIGLAANASINRSVNFHQGFDTYVDNARGWREAQEEDGGQKIPLRHALALFRDAMGLLSEDLSSPTFLMLNLMEVHEYYDASLLRTESRKLYDHISNEYNRRYFQSIHQIDHDLGHFVEVLSATPGWSDSVFFFVSDHGEGLNSHPDVPEAYDHGSVLYESNILVPLIVYQPSQEITHRRIAKGSYRLLDVAPTIAEIAGTAFPREERIDGTSLLDVIQDRVPSPDYPPYFVVETHFRNRQKIGVYAPKMKFIHNIVPHEGTNSLELQPNRIFENGTVTDIGAQHPDKIAILRGYLASWEEAHTTVEAEPANLSPEEIEQLKAIGYMQ